MMPVARELTVPLPKFIGPSTVQSAPGKRLPRQGMLYGSLMSAKDVGGTQVTETWLSIVYASLPTC